ncbi:MAG: hypothetical protein FWC09_00460 [Lachnospiraceae bacterium]|nr:hypothetical protein [Lachnospiraceae bacterium]
MENTVKPLPLTKVEIEKERVALHESLLPLSDSMKSKPYKEVFAEIKENANLCVSL